MIDPYFFLFRHLQIEISEEERAKGLRGWGVSVKLEPSQVLLHAVMLCLVSVTGSSTDKAASFNISKQAHKTKTQNPNCLSVEF